MSRRRSIQKGNIALKVLIDKMMGVDSVVLTAVEAAMVSCELKKSILLEQQGALITIKVASGLMSKANSQKIKRNPRLKYYYEGRIKIPNRTCPNCGYKLE